MSSEHKNHELEIENDAKQNDDSQERQEIDKEGTDAKTWIPKIFGGKSKNDNGKPTDNHPPVDVLPVISGIEYKMDHKRRGKAIIFNHSEFNARDLAKRSGTDYDAKRLKKILNERYGFEVEVHKDFTYGKIYDTLREASEEDYSDCDCVMVVVLSHGDKNKIHAKDCSYTPEQLWLPFTTNSTTLVGKPKIFFIQACRGEQTDPGRKVFKLQTDSTQPKLSTIPVMADILVMYSSFDGYASFRSPESGSWFIQSLCNQLENDQHSHRDFLQILTLVNHEVAMCRISYSPENRDLHKKKQVSSIVSSLTRILYLKRITTE